MPCHHGDGRRTEIGPAHKAIRRALSRLDERARVRLLGRPDDVVAVEPFGEQGNAAEDLLLTAGEREIEHFIDEGVGERVRSPRDPRVAHLRHRHHLARFKCKVAHVGVLDLPAP